jgi:hypothetical protein
MSSSMGKGDVPKRLAVAFPFGKGEDFVAVDGGEDMRGEERKPAGGAVAPGTVGYSGTPLASERPIVDDSFDVGFTMRFDSAASLQAYEKDPRHLKKVNEVLKPLSRKIVVYDIVR